jgi:hypothetical protein
MYVVWGTAWLHLQLLSLCQKHQGILCWLQTACE